MCPEGYFVSGFRVRIEKKQSLLDDTTLNGLAFRCRLPFTSNFEDITIFHGFWGDWREMQEAPDN